MRTKSLMLLFASILLSVVVTAQDVAEQTKAKSKTETTKFEMPEEEVSQEDKLTTKRGFYKYWKESDDQYVRGVNFQKQIARTQIAAGSILLTGGMTMIGFGASMLNTDEGQPNPETKNYETKQNTAAGRTMLITGAFSGVAGIFLLFKGSDNLVNIKNREGKVVGKLGVPKSGNVGVKVEF